MSAWVWTALVLAVVPVLGWLRWWDNRQAQHDEWVRQILGDDREVSELEAMARRVEREHKIS